MAQINDQELFKIAKDTYQHKGVKGWKSLNEFNDAADTKWGLNPTVSKKGNNIVIAYNGTNPLDPRDLYSNYNALAENKIPLQFNDADKLYNQVKHAYPQNNIQFTGYSEGALKASLMSYKTGLPATVFSSTGGKQIAQKHPTIFKYSDANIRTYGVIGDKIFMPNLQNQAGKIFLLPPLNQRTSIPALENARKLKSGFIESHMLHNYPSLNKAKEYNPQKQYIDSRTNTVKTMPENFQKFFGDEKFKRLEPAKYDLSNKPIAGVANGNTPVDATEIIVTYPQTVITNNQDNWMRSLGNLLSGAANLISAGVGFLGGTPSGTTGQFGTSMGGQLLQGNSFSLYHTGGKIEVPKHKGGRNEMIAILQGGETVRTEAQEKELQQLLLKNHMETYAPMVCGENNESDPHAQVFGQNKSQTKDPKIPVLANKTRHDEEMIIAIAA